MSHQTLPPDVIENPLFKAHSNALLPLPPELHIQGMLQALEGVEKLYSQCSDHQEFSRALHGLQNLLTECWQSQLQIEEFRILFVYSYRRSLAAYAALEALRRELVRKEKILQATRTELEAEKMKGEVMNKKMNIIRGYGDVGVRERVRRLKHVEFWNEEEKKEMNERIDLLKLAYGFKTAEQMRKRA
jgi:hypothetical protein